MVKENSTKLLIQGAIIALIVVALIGSLAGESLKRTTLTQVTSNETINIASARSSTANGGITGDINGTITFNLAYYNPANTWKAESSDCNIVIIDYFWNASNRMTLTTDYTYTNDGVISLVNNSMTSLPDTNDTIVVGYSYCANDYLNSSWGRSLLNLTPGLIVIALLVAIVLVMYQVLGKTDED